MVLLSISASTFTLTQEGYYELEELSKMKNIPIKEIQQLGINTSTLKEDWIPIIGRLDSLKLISYTTSQDTNRNVYRFAGDLRKQMNTLENLKSLWIFVDTASIFPNLFPEKNQIENLSISGDTIGIIPSSIANMKHVQRLYISIHNLKKLPKSIGDLTQLLNLYIKTEQLKSLPLNLSQLSKLEYLVISSNSLDTIPNIWNGMNSLLDFRVWAPSLQVIEGNMSVLPLLYNLEIHKAFHLESLPKDIGSIPNLTNFHLDGIQKIISLGNISDSKSLHYLGLEVKHLSNYIQDIKKLGKLNRLSISLSEVLNLKFSEIRALRKIRKIRLSEDELIYDPVYGYSLYGCADDLTEKEKRRLRMIKFLLPRIRPNYNF